jgi:alpha-D-glucose phosphate-specific phosphoglucomutase
MANEQIKFGTDGWRGIIADDFTFDNVRRVGGAVASYVLEYEDARKGLVIGYDTRFASRNFAMAIAEVLAGAGIPIRLSNDYVPTPTISFAVKHFDTAGGVAITSSHNPWQWNGVKFKATFGGSATPAIIKKIETALYAGKWPKQPTHNSAAKIEEIDFKQPYIAAITKLVDLAKIRAAGFRLAVDCMYGSGRDVLAGIFAEHGIECRQIRAELNPLFPGINPEPIEPHVRALQDFVVAEKCSSGFVTDGDADRLGAVTETGEFVDAHKCYAILLQWVLEKKGWPGVVTRAFNTTRMLDRICRKYGRELIEHGIGFKYVADVVLSGREVVMGGEESGGIGFPSKYLPERDGILNSLLLANAMADYGKTLGQMMESLQKEYGRHYYGRRDLHIPEDLKQDALRRAAAGVLKSESTSNSGSDLISRKLTHIGRYPILSAANLDGIKFFLDAPSGDHGAEAWILMRASGTEPLMRLYCEAASKELVNEILESAVAFVMQKSTAA